MRPVDHSINLPVSPRVPAASCGPSILVGLRLLVLAVLLDCGAMAAFAAGVPGAPPPLPGPVLTAPQQSPVPLAPVRKSRTRQQSGAALVPLDPNIATAAQLETIPGIGPAIAARIIEARAEGPFRDADDFQARVRGIGPRLLPRLQAAGLRLPAGSRSVPAVGQPSIAVIQGLPSSRSTAQSAHRGPPDGAGTAGAGARASSARYDARTDMRVIPAGEPAPASRRPDVVKRSRSPA